MTPCAFKPGIENNILSWLHVASTGFMLLQLASCFFIWRDLAHVA
jgi:hypothetical protein